MEKYEEIELQRIKSYLSLKNVKYISKNIIKLLDLNIENDEKCFKNNNVKKDNICRVALYIRLSVEDGDIIDGDVSKSIKNQLLILLDECKKREWIVVAIFCEEGISGTDDNRVEWRKLLKFCEYRNTEIVLCKSQSRFSRSMEMIEKYLHNEFINWNIRFVGLVDSTDTAVVGNKKTRQINGLVNEWQVEDQSINIRAIIKNKQSNGLFTGAFAPYGYKKDPKDKYHLIIDEEAASVVRRIFSMFANGNGVTQICKYLNENKISIPSLYKYEKGSKYNNHKIKKTDTEDIHVWRTNTIYQILKNEVYIGTLVQHKNENISYKNKKQVSVPKEERIIVPHCHKPIIEDRIWKTVNSRFGKKKRVKEISNGEISIFSNKIKCGHCGHKFYRNSKKTKDKTFKYWLCGNRYNYLCKNTKSIKEEELYELILNEINKLIEKYKNKNLIEKSYNEQNILIQYEDNIKNLKKEENNIKEKMQKKENALALMYEDKANKIITLEEFLNLKNKNNIDLENLNVRLNHIKEELKILEIKRNQKIKVKEDLKIEKLNRKIIDTFITNIIISDYDEKLRTRKISIEWNMSI